jgi:hypothetical protein
MTAPPAAYRALAGQLPLLDIDTVSAVVAFYSSLELAKRLSTQHASEEIVPDGHVPLLGNAWRAACRAGIMAMQRIGKYNPPLKHQTDVAMLQELTTELADVLSNKWPRKSRSSWQSRAWCDLPLAGRAELYPFRTPTLRGS